MPRRLRKKEERKDIHNITEFRRRDEHASRTPAGHSARAELPPTKPLMGRKRFCREQPIKMSNALKRYNYLTIQWARNLATLLQFLQNQGIGPIDLGNLVSEPYPHLRTSQRGTLRIVSRVVYARYVSIRPGAQLSLLHLILPPST